MHNKFVSSTIGVKIPATKYGKIYLPDLAILRGKRVKHIDVFHYFEGKVEKCPADEAFLTIREQNTQQDLIQALPLTLLNPKDDRIFINKIIDLPHSYIDTHNMNDIADITFFLVFWYDDPEHWNIVNTKRNSTEIHPLEIQLTHKRTYFEENPILKHKKFQNLILTHPSTTPRGNGGIEYGQENSLYLTLANKGRAFIQNVPLTLFYQSDTPYPLRLQNIEIDLTNSMIECHDNSLIGKSVFFNAVIDDNN